MYTVLACSKREFLLFWTIISKIREIRGIEQMVRSWCEMKLCERNPGLNELGVQWELNQVRKNGN